MKFTPLISLRAATVTAALGAAAMVGCADPAGEEGAESGVAAVAEHGEWWCAEHGVPEEECTRCDASLVAQFKAKDDWCEEHALPDSQCFTCDPALKDKFAARYEAKYGKLPPEPTDI